MDLSVYTWGTGGAFGRTIGFPSSGVRRHQSATSIIGSKSGEMKFHLMVDAGAPCVETMVDNDVAGPPDALFITHPHADHVSDFDKLVNSRTRGLFLSGQPFAPLPVICTRECLDDASQGLKARFGYLASLLSWEPVPDYDVWFSLRLSDGALSPTGPLGKQDITFQMKFKALPVNHLLAPGSCSFIFSFQEPAKKIVMSGDFETIDESVIENPDLMDPDLLLLDSYAIRASGTNHSNWEMNKELITRWASGNTSTLVLLTHIGGFEDYAMGHYDHVVTDEDWKEEIERFTPPAGTRVELARDAQEYPV
jgi:ribonuclease BN (tRNA processing enzyme)